MEHGKVFFKNGGTRPKYDRNYNYCIIYTVPHWFGTRWDKRDKKLLEHAEHLERVEHLEHLGHLLVCYIKQK